MNIVTVVDHGRKTKCWPLYLAIIQEGKQTKKQVISPASLLDFGPVNDLIPTNLFLMLALAETRVPVNLSSAILPMVPSVSIDKE